MKNPKIKRFAGECPVCSMRDTLYTIHGRKKTRKPVLPLRQMAPSDYPDKKAETGLRAQNWNPPTVKRAPFLKGLRSSKVLA